MQQTLPTIMKNGFQQNRKKYSENKTERYARKDATLEFLRHIIPEELKDRQKGHRQKTKTDAKIKWAELDQADFYSMINRIALFFW